MIVDQTQLITDQHLTAFFGTIIVFLLSVIAFFMKRLVEDIDWTKTTLQSHETRITVLEDHSIKHTQ